MKALEIESPRAMSPALAEAFKLDMAVKGRMQAHVVNRKGHVIKTLPWQDNLILDQGMDYYANNSWGSLMLYCVAGTGTTPTRDLIDGTVGQSGTTATLTGGTFVFAVGDVGKWIGWAGGQQAKITAYVSTTQVTVDRSQTVSTAAATLYRANQTGLATEVKRSNTYPAYTYTDGRQAQVTYGTAASGILTLRRTYDFTAEVGSVNYTEIGISPVATVASNLFARILLAGTVTVTSGQQLRITYELAVTCSGYNRPTQTLTSSTGWPYTYNISSITGNGTTFTVTTSASHHYIAGGSITIAGAKRTRTTITVATSNSTDFTITANSHGRSPGDSIIIEGMTPVGYNGTWTIASSTANTITVTTAANPGGGTIFGNVRQAEPGTWYDGTWTIASVTSTTILVTSAISLAAGADGTVKNNLNAVLYLINWPINPIDNGATSIYSPDVSGHWGSAGVFGSGNNNSPGTGSGGDQILDGTCSLGSAWPNNCQLYGRSTALTTPGAFPLNGTYAASGGTAYSCTTATLQAYTNGNFYRDVLMEWGTGAGNASDIRALMLTGIGNNLGSGLCNLAWFFDQPQRKDSTNRLRITFRRAWSRVLA